MDWLYERNADNSARFILGTVGKNPLICFGVNPSTAEPNKLDQTLKRVSKYASINGFDSWIMLNIYPQRATLPNEMHYVCDDSIFRKNIECIANILEKRELMIWAAWGKSILIRKYLVACLQNINEFATQYGCHWVSLGSTSSMHPCHPLYRNKGFQLYSSQLVAFDIEEYISRFSAPQVIIKSIPL